MMRKPEQPLNLELEQQQQPQENQFEVAEESNEEKTPDVQDPLRPVVTLSNSNPLQNRRLDTDDDPEPLYPKANMNQWE